MTRKYPREFLVSEIKRVARLLGKIPTREEFRSESKVSPVTVAKRFGGWTSALSSAGFDPGKARLTYTDLELLGEFQRLAQVLGRTPTTTDFNEQASIGSASTLTQRFGGSWDAVCSAAGLPPPNRPQPTPPGAWNKGRRKLKLSEDDLRYLYDVEGLSASAIAAAHGVSAQTVLRALREHGIEVRRLHYSMPRETAIETKLYKALETRKVPFSRQQVVDGFYVVDALIPGAKIIVECDGEYWHSLRGREEADRRRQRYLESRGYLVLRFPEAAIHADADGCATRVVEALIDRVQR